jgi:hypothetical protein
MRVALGDPAVWESPDPNLEDRLVAEIERQQTFQTPRRRWRRSAASAAALTAAAVLGATVTAGAFLRRPDWSTDLVASELAPAATAHVQGWLTDEGTRVRLDVGGLRPLGPGEYYEIWLTAEDGRHVSAGSFTSPGVIESWIGVRRRDFPRVWITIEPTDDDLGPSGATVLDDPDYS